MSTSTKTKLASYFERTAWDGDQVLYEIRTPASTPTSDTPSGGTYHAFGRVVYLHGGGLDAPLAVSRLGLSGQPAEVTVAPHADWQDDFVGGSLMSGASQAPCTGASGCPVIDWPGGKMTTDGVVPTPAMQAWWGRFLQSQVDASGLRYQRNRFYDPLTGQFTQQDPIGLAGGINLYAIAGGDPVNFRDPFGLCTPMPECLYGFGSLRQAWQDFTGGAVTAGKAAAGDLRDRLSRSVENTVACWSDPVCLGSMGLGGAARVGGLTAAEEMAIQRFANKRNAIVTVVGSRAAGTAGLFSDFDYIVAGAKGVRSAARRELPGGLAGGEISASGRETGRDILEGPLDVDDKEVVHRG